MIRLLNLLTFFIFCCTQIRAQNNLRLIALDGNVFKIKVKNEWVNKTAQSSVLVEHLEDDTLLLTFEFETFSAANIPVYLLEKGKKRSGKEFNYRVEVAQQQVKLIYDGIYNSSTLPKPLVPKKPVVDTMLANRNRFMGHLCEIREGEPTFFNNIPKDGTCKTKMPDEYMNFVPALMRKADTDDEKGTLVEAIFRNNCISVEQLAGLLKFIDYDIEKLKLIKLSYHHLTDPGNSSSLSKSLRFESAVTELNSFLKHPEDFAGQTAANCTIPSDSVEVRKFRYELSVHGNDAERFLVFKKRYSDYCYSIEMARDLLVTFIHDREKTDAAKAMYYYCTDKKNFLQLADVFSYNESKSVLKNFVEKQSK